ncbi:Putative periplasmic protein YibQ, distant homology with nucleoside diphosphatase and polysaccharide deacetylase [Olavius sp. associated proteobacterium Delta 1]|nr:Putative periplasmic protein YibQ, distant homology with nucleoside diphosphatase and polysaccharide deacetylase [Olavius sp. associated proteobacterium Delta 1]
MAKRKTTRKKKVRNKSRQNKLFKSSLLKAFVGVACLFVLVVLAGALAHFLMTPEKPLRPRVPPAKSVPVAKKPIAKIPPFEIYPEKEIPPEKKPTKPPPPEKKQLPLVAIIIDDLGYDKKIAENFSKLHSSITFSILPHSPFQDSIARLSKDNGLETMLHLPMEPIEYPNVDPGPGTLLTSMTPDQLIRQLKENLKALPQVKGVNNHMGSKMTAESSQMYQIFSILKKKGLYFVDSRTSPQTLCKPSARLLQVPFAQRDVFLDHLQEPRFIRKQINELIRIARRNGYAVGIGHPHSTTYRVLREMLPELNRAVQLVPASKIVHRLG